MNVVVFNVLSISNHAHTHFSIFLLLSKGVNVFEKELCLFSSGVWRHKIFCSSCALKFQVSLGDKAKVAGAGVHEAKDPSVNLGAAAEYLARAGCDMTFLSWEKVRLHLVQIKRRSVSLLFKEGTINLDSLGQRLG